MKPTTRGIARRVTTVIAALVLGLTALLQNLGTAHAADQIQPFNVGSMRLSRTDGSSETIVVWDRITLSGEWRVEDLKGHAGDYFTLTLPTNLEGIVGTFELDGVGENAGVSFGTCTVSQTEMRCELNSNVEGKNNVGGGFNLNLTVADEHATNAFEFTINGNTPVSVPLPNGQPNIGFASFLPTDIEKFGYLVGDPLDRVRWRFRIPGSALQGTTLTVQDSFGVVGSTLSVVDGTPQLLAVPMTTRCFNKDFLPECRTVLSAQINVDAAGNTISMTYDNSAVFDGNTLYIFEFELRVAEEILVGAEFPNTASVNDTVVTATATRDASGSGTGSGDYVGHIRLVKNVAGATAAVPSASVYPVTYQYTYKGQVRTGTVEVKGDGSETRISNIPGGSVVTLTEGTMPTVANVAFKDPVFAGTGVVDGGASSNSAEVTISSTTPVDVSLTNTAVNVVSDPALPTADAGRCEAPFGKTNPSLTFPTTPGVRYEVDPNRPITDDGTNVTFYAVATTEAGYEFAQNLANDWTRVSDTKATWTSTLPSVACFQTVQVDDVPVDVTASVCPVGTYTPTEPTITLKAAPTGITYNITKQPTLENGRYVFDILAAPRPGYSIDRNLPDGWERKNDGTASFRGELPVADCAKTVSPVLPTVDAGVCPVGATVPSAPSWEFAATEGVRYDVQQPVVAGGKVTFTARAVVVGADMQFPESFAQDLVDGGWTRVSATEAEFTKTIDAPACAPIKMVPIVPFASASVCPVGSYTPTTPVVSFGDHPAGLTYALSKEPVLEGDVFVYEVTATPDSSSFAVDPDNLPAGWTVDAASGVATFKGQVPAAPCAKTVSPVLPTLDAGVCPVGATAPTAPSWEFAPTEGVRYDVQQPVVAGGKVTFTARAEVVGADMQFPESFAQDLVDGGWTRISATEAEFTKTVDAPVCEAIVAEPVAPAVGASVCPADATAPTQPEITLPQTTGLIYEVTAAEIANGSFTYTVTAKPASSAYVLPDTLPAGWVKTADGASLTASVTVPSCVTPADPVMNAGTCPANATTPSEPTISAAETPGVVYSEVNYTVENGQVTFSAKATTAEGYQFGGPLGEGWTRVSGTEATFVKTVAQPSCQQPTPVTVVTPKIAPSVCKPGSPTPTVPVVELPQVPGLVYGTPEIKVDNKLVTITVTATPESGYVINRDDLPSGWTVNEDGSATFSYQASQPECTVKAKPGLPRTGA